MSETQCKPDETAVLAEVRQLVQQAINRGVTRTLIARRARVARTQLHRLMLGRVVSIRTLARIAHAVGGRVAVYVPLVAE
jgi:DNA-binding phage protein